MVHYLTKKSSFLQSILKIEKYSMSNYLEKKPSLKFLIVDTYSIFLNGTVNFLRSRYPGAEIITAQTAIDALNQVSIFQPNLVVMDIYLQEKSGMIPDTNTGIQFLQYLMKCYPHLNITVQSTCIRRLIEIIADIDTHNGGFTSADKSISSDEIITKINWALQGLTDIKEIQDSFSQLSLKPELLQLLNLAFKEGLQDRAIAQNICVSERMVRYYWDNLQTALSIDSEEIKKQGKNLRIVTQIRARELGLIDD
jgi:DNA-binding NarL/FixJ family response regulator